MFKANSKDTRTTPGNDPTKKIKQAFFEVNN